MKRFIIITITALFSVLVLYLGDKTGKKYNKGNGLSLFRDNILVAKSSKIEKITYSMR